MGRKFIILGEKIKLLESFKKALVLVILSLAPVSIDAQVTQENYVRAEQFLPWNANKLVFKTQVIPNWIEKGHRFWYKNNTRHGKEFVFVDPDRKNRQLAFDHVKLAASLSSATGKAYEHNKLPFDSFEFIQRGGAIQFDIEENRWTWDLTTYHLAKALKPKERPKDELLSPDGQFSVFVKGHNLYLRSIATEEEIQLTSDGEPYYDYASPPESRLSEVTDRVLGRKLPPVAIWSPDSRKLITYKLDQRKVGQVHLIQSVPPAGSRPILHSYRYPLPGDKEVPLAELVIFDISQKKKVKVDSRPLLALIWSPLEFQAVWWAEDSQRVYYIEEGRGQKTLKLQVVEALTGATRTLIEEKSSTYAEFNLTLGARPNVRVLRGGSEIIWFSERDGWAHIYLYDGKTGALKNQITSGTWVVRDIVHLDETNRWVYFTASGRENGRDPYYRHLYRIKLDGSNLELLSPEDADHSVIFSPAGNCFVDTYSRVDTAPVSVLRRADGKKILELEKADVELLLATGWKWPEPIKVKARDGITDIYGVIYRPSNFSPEKKYPALDSIYPGPQIIRSPKSFTSDPLFQALAMAELGFIVVTLDGMGTPLRSKAFHDVSYGNLGEAGGLEDHIAGLRQLAARYPYIDLNRVGIYGHSGGGFASTRAILAYPDFYKVAVSSAGNHDQQGYIALWGEKYQGLPEGDNYLNQVNAKIAANLKGKLLLVYGDMDDNVHPSTTIQLVDSLIKANKDFDLLIMPNRNHGSLSQDPYFIRKRWDYFVRHLLGEEPPKDFKIKGPAR